MRKTILAITIAIASITNMGAQNKVEVFGEVTSYNLSEYNYTIDAYYRVADNFSISSWNTITSGRGEIQGYNYSIMSLMFNWNDKKNNNTFSVGYGEINQISYDFNNRAIIVKLRVKLL
jgi:hypothetical protein